MDKKKARTVTKYLHKKWNNWRHGHTCESFLQQLKEADKEVEERFKLHAVSSQQCSYPHSTGGSDKNNQIRLWTVAPCTLLTRPGFYVFPNDPNWNPTWVVTIFSVMMK